MFPSGTGRGVEITCGFEGIWLHGFFKGGWRELLKLLLQSSDAPRETQMIFLNSAPHFSACLVPAKNFMESVIFISSECVTDTSPRLFRFSVNQSLLLHDLVNR
jgi:hypothetical protein